MFTIKEQIQSQMIFCPHNYEYTKKHKLLTFPCHVQDTFLLSTDPLSIEFCTAAQCKEHVPQHLSTANPRQPLMAPLQCKLYVII